MWQHAAPVAFTLFAWWFSTGAILYVVGLPRQRHKWVMAAGTAVLIGALLALLVFPDGSGNVYAAFGAALTVWGWQELAFLLGYVTGPRRTPCPRDATGWRRVRYALAAIAHHEVALLALGVLLLLLAPGDGPAITLWTFAALWALRASAKLNVFLGVRNLNEQFLPGQVAYLFSYFRQRPMNRLFPITMGLGSGAALWLWQTALARNDTGLVLVATLVTLGVVEHVMMVLPLPSHGLWAWGLKSRQRGG